MKNKKIWERLLEIVLLMILFVYMFALIRIVLLKNGFITESRGINYIPFTFIKEFTSDGMKLDILLKNVLGNFAIFTPLGIFIPIFFKNMKLTKTTILVFLVSLSFEIIQFITGLGFSDIDDLILNTLGVTVGALLYLKLFMHSGKRIKANGISLGNIKI